MTWPAWPSTATFARLVSRFWSDCHDGSEGGCCFRAAVGDAATSVSNRAIRSPSRQMHQGLECLGVEGGYESDLFAAKDLGTIGPVGIHRRTRLRIFAGFVKSLVLSET